MRNKFFSVLALLMISSAAHADLDVVVTGIDTAATPIAIVPFAGLGAKDVDMSQVIDADLGRTGQFRTLSRGSMPEQPSDPAGLHQASWRSANTDYVVMGQARRDPATGNVSVRFYLVDTLRGAQLLAYDMPAASPGQLRYVSHQIADLVYEKLTGIKGAFTTKIAYVTANGLGNARRFELVVADADGYSPRAMAVSREPLMSPSWSPDRKQLAYVGYERGRTAIYIHTLASGQVRKLVSEKGINGSPAWSPDGKSMAAVLSFETNPDIYVFNVATGSRRRLTDHYGIDTEPSWAPDGQSLIFTSDRGGQPQIYQLPIDGGDAKRVTFVGKQNLRASYSPDGKSLVVVNYDDGRYRIALLDLASGSMKIISDGPLDESPSFAPNGMVVIYATQGRQGAELATSSIDGRTRQRMRQPGDVREPAWSPQIR
ncbi:Tol-Pal system beta propeller repeat protein TolB [Stenotrophobium rhamnosiphilum]|uniref:Tol-Pal system protein TolB n=1 Tax=Stenotrophobium rhamnosiphilum TaxID=2029166 RepID=A0A2T5MHC5_9GAMM|nr:Tol-Pal system beta propeller repeat protein TolB [Stenotrophobium rhamnosiphilum]PTU31949.1 Tol-Pal system beta propeller repeat protein TolB [Stenotrophobium rhamnosiphilum]